jgi:hypothetical protein
MRLMLLPLMGPLHLRYPSYNAVSVRDLVERFAPEAVAVTALAEGELDDPAWQSTPEVALPLAVVPWARRRGLPLYTVLEPSPDPDAGRDFQRYLGQYPQGRVLLAEVEAALRPLAPLLEEPLDLPRLESEVLPLLHGAQTLRERLFEEGPGTDWLRARARVMAARVLALDAARVAVLAGAEHLPLLREALADRAELVPAPEAPPSEAARLRALLDFAFRGEAPEPGKLIASLRALTEPEARYHEANLLLAHGHAAEALDALEKASHGDFSEPYFLPGYLLARLGQLRDMAGERDAARRAYRAVRALSWAPEEALEAAAAGLAAAFEGADAANAS